MSLKTQIAFAAPIRADWLLPPPDGVESEARSLQSRFSANAFEAAVNAADAFSEKQEALDFISRRVSAHRDDYSPDFCEAHIRRWSATPIAWWSRVILSWAQGDPYAEVRQTFGQPASEAALVDSGWLFLLYPGFMDTLDSLARRLNEVAVQADVPWDQSLRKVAAAITLGADGNPDAIDFWREMVKAALAYPPDGGEILLGAAYLMTSGKLILPGYVPCWYPPYKRPGPDRDGVARAGVWGHYLVSLVVRSQTAALEFWHSYALRDKRAVGFAYSQPGQDPKSKRAQSAYVMAKGRLLKDLEGIGALPWPALSGSHREPSAS